MLFFDKIKLIENAVKLGPNKVDFQKDIAPYLDEEASRGHFYRLLKNNPDWLEVLYNNGEIFRFSEIKEIFNDNVSITIRDNVATKYLVEIASFKPEEVLDIIIKMPDTDNGRIHEDYIKVACNIPPEYAIISPLFTYVSSLTSIWLTCPYTVDIPSPCISIT